MAFKQKTIATRLLTGFATLLALTLLLGVLSIRWMESLAKTSSDILDHPFTVSVAIATVRAEILTNQLALMQLARSSEPDMIQMYSSAIYAHRAKVDREIATVRARYLGQSPDVDRLVQALEHYRAVGNEVITLAKAGQPSKASALVDDQAAPLATEALQEVANITAFATSKGEWYQRDAATRASAALATTLGAFILITALGILVAVLITRSIAASLKVASQTVTALLASGKDKVLATETVAAGDFNHEIHVTEPLRLDLASLPKDDLGVLLRGIAGLSAIQAALDVSFRKMTGALRRAREEERHSQWLKSSMVDLDSQLRGEQTVASLAPNVLDFIACHLQAGAGSMYLYRDREQDLERVATYATAADDGPREHIALGEGIIGQAAQEGRMLTLREVPRNYLTIASSLGAATPAMVVALPFAHNGKLIGAMELATFKPFTPVELGFLAQATDALAIGFQVNLARQLVNELLAQSQAQEEELRVQQEELQQSNEELEERTRLLEHQQEEISAKTLEVERVSAYKSEFLANMSHELRTPLNSLMILSEILKDNADGNLTDKQVEYASTVNSAGKELLELINGILDLSKIEAGQLEFNLEETSAEALCQQIERTFLPLAERKGLAFSVAVADDVPALIRTDPQRCHQILQNLVANALKFTLEGSVTLRAYLPPPEANPLQAPAIAFRVVDTGIGIAQGKHELIFQAFQQADGTTSRRFGGTGLGLSISRQLARGLHGEILLVSEEGVGSTLTLYLPLPEGARAGSRPEPVPPPPAGALEGADPRGILVIEDNREPGQSLTALLQTQGIPVRTAGSAAEATQVLATQAFAGVVLDLPPDDRSGFDLPAQLQWGDEGRRIPVIIHTARELSRKDESRLKHFAEAIILKGAKSPERLLNEVALLLHGQESAAPAAGQRAPHAFLDSEAVFAGKKVLIADDDMRNVFALSSLLAEREMVILEAENGKEALARLQDHPDTRIVLMDIMMPEMDGYAAIRSIREDPRFTRLPIIALTAKAMKGDREACMQAGASDYITKPIDPERLLSLLRVWLYDPA